jgi:hypothetical protein
VLVRDFPNGTGTHDTPVVGLGPPTWSKGTLVPAIAPGDLGLPFEHSKGKMVGFGTFGCAGPVPLAGRIQEDPLVGGAQTADPEAAEADAEALMQYSVHCFVCLLRANHPEN